MNVFISQPMTGYTDEQIETKRQELMKYCREHRDDLRHEIVDNKQIFNCDLNEMRFIDQKDTLDCYDSDQLTYIFILGVCISAMSNADIVVFAEGWEKSRGCQIEKDVCDTYGIPYIMVQEQPEKEIHETDAKLDELAHHMNENVRTAVARAGLKLDVLIDDPCWFVRTEVAYNGYGLHRLVNDPSQAVRIEVARQGYGLEQLVNDESIYVRAEVARQGYGLDQLMNDPVKYVADIAFKEINRQNFFEAYEFMNWKDDVE